MAYHLTGLYPRWWEGRRFTGPTRWWAGGDSLEACRDNPQRILLGHNLDELLGTGLIPRHLIGRVTRKQIPDACDKAMVKHVSGGWSQVGFKSFDQGRKKWQGATLHGIWVDEEPPWEVYSEALARLTHTRGMIFITATPAEGMTKVISCFYPEPNTPERGLIMADVAETQLYTPEEIAKKEASYEPYERDARIRGIPMLGEGPIYPVPEAKIRVDPFTGWERWPGLIAMDFGHASETAHPTAAVHAVYDKMHDTIYIVREYRQESETIAMNARAIKALGGDKMPVVWPHDGMQIADRAGRNEGSIADLYRREGVRMWPNHSTFPEGGYGLQASIEAVWDRMRTDRFKVFSSCPQWFEEFRTYHRKRRADGKSAIVRMKDDLMSATQKAVMMIRVARAPFSTQDERQTQTATPIAGWNVFDSLSRKAF